MKHALLRASLAAGCFCIAAPALAVTPFLSGSYTVNIETVCPAGQTVDTTGKALSITPTSAGEISHTAGAYNFFATGLSGTIKTSYAVTDGSAILSKVNGNAIGNPFSLSDAQTFGGYRMTSSTLTITFDKQQPVTYEAVYGNTDSSGIIQAANLLTVSDDATPCGTLVLMHLQQPGGR
jgi:hypothetical protein